MTEEKLISEILSKIDRTEKALNKRYDWIKYYELYRNYRESGGFVGRSNEGLALAFEWVEVVRARLFDRFCGRKPFIRVVGREPSDDAAAKGIQAFMSWQLDNAGYRKVIYDLLTETLIYGTGILKYYWRYDVKTKKVPVPITSQAPSIGLELIDRPVVTYDNVALETVDVFDFVVDPEATVVDDARWAAHRTRKTAAYLQDMQKRGIYQNVDAVIQEIGDGDKGGVERDTLKQQKKTIEGTSGYNTMLKPVELWEYWEPDRVVVVANGKHIVRDSKNVYGRLPFLASKIIDTPHEFYGIGLVEMGAPSIRLMEDLLNNIMDNVNFAINSMIVVDETRVDDSELVSRPGGIIHTMGNVDNAVRQLPIMDLTGNAIRIFDMVNQLSKRITGVNDYITGTGTGGYTATEAQLMQSASSQRINMHISVFGSTLVEPLCKVIHELNGMFVTGERYVRVTGYDENPYQMIKITPDMFLADVDYIWETDTRELDNALAIQQLIQALTLAQANPALTTFTPIIFYKILELFGLHDNDELMRAANVSKNMANVLTLMTAMGGGLGGSGAANPKKFPQDKDNVIQSERKGSVPDFGSMVNVK